MAGGADRVGAVDLDRLPRGELPARLDDLQVRDVRRRRRRRRGQDVFQDPLAAFHDRGAVVVGRHRQYAGLAQQAAATQLRVEVHPAHRRAVHARYAVVLGQPLVDERIVGVEEGQDAAVLAEHRHDEHVGLVQHRLAEPLVEIPEHKAVRMLLLEVANIEPLSGEIVRQGLRLGIGEHPRDLTVEDHRVVKPAFFCNIEEVVVRDAAPEEERQPRGEFEVADRMDRAGRTLRGFFMHEQEVRGHQDGLQRRADSGLKSAAGATLPGVDPHERREVRLGHRTAVGLAGQLGQDEARAGVFGKRARRVADEDLSPARRQAGVLNFERAPDGDLQDVAREIGLEVVVRRGERRDVQRLDDGAVHVEVQLQGLRRGGIPVHAQLHGRLDRQSGDQLLRRLVESKFPAERRTDKMRARF